MKIKRFLSEKFDIEEVGDGMIWIHQTSIDDHMAIQFTDIDELIACLMKAKEEFSKPVEPTEQEVGNEKETIQETIKPGTREA